MRKTLIEINGLSKSFPKPDHNELLVLEHVDFALREGEIVALLGKSGSGKSTLLRIIAGLIPQTKGDVCYRGQPVSGPVDGIAMVFQSFALMPWLTVLQNVELGLEAKGVPRQDRRQRALKAIDTIGMDGFESAFPKELSGGMRQRVGFARALVVNPDILLMDEPFSALDVLTADNLKSDLLDLWQGKKTETNGILLVTHNIHEAVELADRIIIFDSDPGTIRAELTVDLAHPRDEESPEYRALVDRIYHLMTTTAEDARKPAIKGHKYKDINMGYRFPDVDVAALAGLVEAIAEENETGKIDLPELADDLQLEAEELLNITEVLEVLRFADIAQGDISLTPEGLAFANADIQAGKPIFARHLLRHVPLARHIRRVLDERESHRAPAQRFLEELEDYLSDQEAERVMKTIIEWGRYAELFAYDHNTESLSLDNPD
ncbi:MAG: ABC transporter ATP-binding protein [marine bacterium B5-7]|nr:MAG: ABC transporter ATP-binding protein [marine bacterium B5-7]